MNTNFPLMVHVVFSDMADQMLQFSGAELSSPYTDDDSSVESVVGDMVARVYPHHRVVYQYITTQFCAQGNGILRVWFVATPLNHSENVSGLWTAISDCDTSYYPQQVRAVLEKYSHSVVESTSVVV